MSGHHTAAVHWGTPSPQFQEWETTKVYCHGFAGLSTARGAPANSPKFMCVGNRWHLKIYPGGCIRARDDYVTIGLANMSDKSINILFYFVIKCMSEYEIREVSNSSQPPNRRIPRSHCFERKGSKTGIPNFATRAKVLKSLVYGTLIIKVHMKLVEPNNVQPPPRLR